MIVTRITTRLANGIIEHWLAGKRLIDWNGVVAYCNIYLDNCFVIQEVRFVSNSDGIRVSMPDRKLSFRFKCGHKNSFDNSYCSTCGTRRSQDDASCVNRRYIDTCHPITQEFRHYINAQVTAAVNETIETELRLINTELSQSS